MSTRPLRVCCGINLDATPPNDLRAYMMRGIEFNKAAGFDALDFNTALTRYAPDDYLDVMAEAKAYAADLGLRFELCHLPFGNKPWTVGKAWDDFTAYVKRCIDAASVLGVDYAVMHPVSTTKLGYECDYNAALNLDVACLKPFVEYGSEKGVNIVVENMRIAAEQEGEMTTPFILGRENGEAGHLCNVADKLGIGICWDTGHSHIGSIVQSEALHTIGGERLKMLHICDNHKYLDEHLAPFFGSIDWKDFAFGLADIGYTGLINFEVSANRLPPSTRELYAALLIDAAASINAWYVERADSIAVKGE